MSRAEKARLFALGTPAAIVLNLILLMPVRYLALGKLFDNRWQTREAPVETDDVVVSLREFDQVMS